MPLEGKFSCLALDYKFEPEKRGGLVHNIEAVIMISELRPYKREWIMMFSPTTTVPKEVESMVDVKTFTLADLIAFAEGVEAYVKAKCGKHLLPKYNQSMYSTCADVLLSHECGWLGAMTFHMQLNALWNELDERVQKMLRDGGFVKNVIDKLKEELVHENRALCNVDPTFFFME